MNNKYIIISLLLCLVSSVYFIQGQSVADNTFTYTNPLTFSYPYADGHQERTISELRDPAIIREGDTYYLTFTHFPFTHSSSLDADKPDNNSSPGIRLYSSKDLKNWTFEKWLVKSSELPEDCPYKHRFWAPEIHKIKGRFYLIFTADNWNKDAYNKGGKIGSYVAFVGVADKVTGPYEHITWLKGAGCDSTLFADDDGKTYAIMPFGDEFIQEVDLSGIDSGNIKLVGERTRIVTRDNSDVGKKTSPDYMEGPWMIKRNGKYVLFTGSPYREKKGEAVGTRDLASGYWVGAAVADHVLGPYKKEPQVFLGGHIAVFTGPDDKEWLSYRGESGGQAQGRLCIDPIPFNADGSVQRFAPTVTPTWYPVPPPPPVKRYSVLLPAATDTDVRVIRSLPSEPNQGLYSPNRAPLKPVPFMKLPPGAVTPKGWLRHQLELDAEGITGRLDEISRFLQYETCGWVHPEKPAGEELAYWFRGYVDLGFVLKDERILKEAKKWIDGILATVQPDGYFGPQNRKTAELDKCETFPHMAIMFAFRSYYDYAHDPKVLALITGFYRWIATQPDSYFRSGWGAARWETHLSSIHWLYNRTGDPLLLELSKRIQTFHPDWLNGVPTAHNVNFAENFRAPALCWQQNSDPKFLDASLGLYQKVMDEHGQFSGGGFAGDEGQRSGYGDPRQGFETCGYVEYLLSFEELTRLTGQPVWADRCEEIAFNSLPAVLTPDHRAVHYISCDNSVQLDKVGKTLGQFGNGDYPMLAYEPSPHNYRCCTHNYGMGWPYFAESLWLATADRGLCASLYAASEVNAKVADGVEVSIAEETDYPFGETIDFHVRPSKAAAFPLYLRVPRWTKGASVRINGQPAEVKADPLSYICITRIWNPGDAVTLRLPMQIDVLTWAKNRDSVSVNYGPLTFSLDIGEKWTTFVPEKYPASAGVWNGYEVFPTTPWNYGLVVDPQKPAQSLEIVHKPGPLAADPFTHEGFPLLIKAKARKIPGWQTDPDGVVGPLQQSPARTTAPVETVNLIPMAAARLRITSFPTVTEGASGHDWVPAPKGLVTVTSSYREWPWFPGALMYGLEPASSHDNTLPRFTWWNRRGSREWLSYKFPNPVRVSSAAVYWFDDRDHRGEYPGSGEYRVPQAWNIEYNDGSSWKPVAAKSPAGLLRDAYSRIEFEPVVTKALRLAAELEKGRSVGLYVWKVFDGDLQLVPAQSQAAVDKLGAGVAMAASGAAPLPESWFKPVTFKDITEGQDVPVWPDQASGGNDARVEGGGAPTAIHNVVNGQSMAHFDASKKQRLSFVRTVQDDFTIAVLFRSTQGIGTGRGFFQGAGLLQGETSGEADDFGLSLNACGEVLAGTGKPDTTLVSPPGFNDGKPHLAMFSRVKATGALTLVLDGRTVATGKGGTQSLTAPKRLCLGADPSGNNHFTGEIGEVAVYGHALAGKKSAKIAAALMTRWGIE